MLNIKVRADHGGTENTSEPGKCAGIPRGDRTRAEEGGCASLRAAPLIHPTAIVWHQPFGVNSWPVNSVDGTFT